MAYIKEALKKAFRKMREQDEEVDLKNIHPILWSIDKYEIPKNFLTAVGVAATFGFMSSNSPNTWTTETHIAAAVLPASFATLFIGLLIRKNSTKISWLFQLVGIGLAIFALSASAFGFLTPGLRWIPVLMGILCLGILVIPVPYLISYKREGDVANGEANPPGSRVSSV